MDKHMEYRADTQTLIGEKMRHLVDTETGERIDVNQITKRVYGQKSFWKVYLMDFLQVLGILDSKQVDVLIYILEHTEPANNTFIGSQRAISDKSGVSLSTVSRIMSKLQEQGFLTIQLLYSRQEHGKQHLLFLEEHLLLLLWTFCSQLQIHSIYSY